MALGEFDLIRRFFTRQPVRHASTALGVGDDCALLRCAAGAELAVTVDTLVSGVHFLPEVEPDSLGHKALAVNLSDLAAMGAEPRWATLALTLPGIDEGWLAAFARGLFALAERHGVEIVGGDTTRGPLSITIQAMGWVPEGRALRRSGARPGDGVYVSGPIGSAGLGLKQRLGQTEFQDAAALARLERPEPRVALGLQLRGLASACIDVSDGLAADLGHILAASNVGATLDCAALPLADGVARYIATTGDWAMPLGAGDDYELCFTVPEDRRDELARRLAGAGLAAFPIGRIEAEPGLRLLKEGRLIDLNPSGYEHFSRT
ncbi:thiamine-phosphate kinase [Methylomagnum ishizawai]|uniref:thiamine-phosphate kinase n=1 Tax=Methylomagnum ishizawai TaxID=1760988 RepID=UPI001C334BE1|nr:thiamine-phosphate kinase [Methylomagnum ishizawai]BBL75479.1 thiamine-monophosphate kinase [Methylomagnum ishizawai]